MLYNSVNQWRMDFVFKNLINKQRRFFSWYYLVVGSLILWSYIEGVGDIQGQITVLDQAYKGGDIFFKAGYFSTLNYGIYYVFIMPLFLKSAFETYRVAFEISALEESNVVSSKDTDEKIREAVKDYSSKIVVFLQSPYSKIIMGILLVFFIYEGIYVELKKTESTTIGWVQGFHLKKEWDSRINKQEGLLRDSSYFQPSSSTGDKFLEKYKGFKISNLSFVFERKKHPVTQLEFKVFVVFAKLFYTLFETFVFFYNFNMLYCVIHFFMEENKRTLFKSELFIKHIEALVTKISLTGFFLTIFVYFRYIANMQKGSFTAFSWNHVFSNDQYLFLTGMLFIPATSIILFLYIYLSDTSIDIKAMSLKRIVSLYLPAISFLIIFFIYLLQFDPYMKGQLGFLTKPLKYISDYLGG